MTDATLNSFREIADAMKCGQDATWAVCRQYLDGSGHPTFAIVAFGYTKERAEVAAKLYRGGIAIPEADAMAGYANRTRKPVTPQVGGAL